MAKPKLVQNGRSSRARAAAGPTAEPAPLGQGITAAVIELRSGASYRVRTVAGTRYSAALADGVDPGLAEECLRDGRTVLLSDSPRGVLILGAVQTGRTPVREVDGSVAIEGKDVRIRAERSVVLDAGPVSIRADKSGLVRIEGEKMILDLTALVRVLSARMEIP